MKTGVSRKKTRIAIALLAVVAVIILVGILVKQSTVLMIGAIALLADYVLLLSTTRCPNCGEYFFGLYWSKKRDVGLCKKCGEHIQFDDQMEEP